MIERVRKVVDAMKEAFDIFAKMELPIEERKCTIEYDSAIALINGFEQLERERDAAVRDIERLVKSSYEVVFCDICKYGSDEEECQKRNCNGDRRDFEWRGAQGVE